MSQGISPYALLRASMPKQTPTMITPYDLYSGIQHTSAEELPMQFAAQEQATGQHTDQSSDRTPSHRDDLKKTHYISEIQSRHNAAARRTKMHAPLKLSYQVSSSRDGIAPAPDRAAAASASEADSAAANQLQPPAVQQNRIR